MIHSPRLNAESSTEPATPNLVTDRKVHCTSDWMVDGGLGSILRLGVDPEVQCTLQKIGRGLSHHSTLNPQHSTLLIETHHPDNGNGLQWCIALLIGWRMVVLVSFRDWVLIRSAVHPTKNFGGLSHHSTLNPQHSTLLIETHHPDNGNGLQWCTALRVSWWMVVLVPFRSWVLIPKCSAPYKKFGGLSHHSTLNHSTLNIAHRNPPIP